MLVTVVLVIGLYIFSHRKLLEYKVNHLKSPPSPPLHMSFYFEQVKTEMTGVGGFRRFLAVTISYLAHSLVLLGNGTSSLPPPLSPPPPPLTPHYPPLQSTSLCFEL
jgi:hypothetical protein